jgi:hypothetical protein
MTILALVFALLAQSGAASGDSGQAQAQLQRGSTERLLPFRALRSADALIADGALEADVERDVEVEAEVEVEDELQAEREVETETEAGSGRSGRGAPITKVLRFCSALDAAALDGSDASRDSARLGLGVLRARFGAPIDGAKTLELDVGPLLVEPAEPSRDASFSPSIWWPNGAGLRVALREATPVAGARPSGEVCLEPFARLASVIPRSPDDLERAAHRHRQALDALRKMKEDPEGARVGVAIGSDDAPALATDLFELVTWLELSDAVQASLRIGGKVKAADAVVADMRALLRAIRATGLDALLAERVPVASEGFASLALHESWPHDAWQLVEPALRLSASLDRTRREFLALAERIGRESGLAKEGVERLKSRLETVAENMPPGFEWTQRFGDDCADHMRAAFQPDAEFGGARRAPPFDPSDPIVSAIYAQTVAFEIFGYAWSQPGAMPPSLEAKRQAMLSTVAEPIRAALSDGSLVGPSGVDHGREALDLMERFLASEDTRWKPWIVFPTTPEVAAYAATRLRESLDLTVREFYESFEPGVPNSDRVEWQWVIWDIDAALAVEGGMRAARSGRRPWIFPDTVPLMTNGYVPIRKW